VTPPTSHGAAGREARVQRLRAARTQDSTSKIDRSLKVIHDLLASGQRITIARVAREASVSTWFVYNQLKVRETVQTAMHEQHEHKGKTSPSSNTQQVSPAGLHTELALAREEIKDLKKERDRLRERVQLSLGAELDDVDRRQLVERVQQLERQNAELNGELSEARDRLTALKRKLQESEDDLTAARATLRRAMRAVPSE
jgi:chromosome segregation ATPase